MGCEEGILENSRTLGVPPCVNPHKSVVCKCLGGRTGRVGVPVPTSSPETSMPGTRVKGVTIHPGRRGHDTVDVNRSPDGTLDLSPCRARFWTAVLPRVTKGLWS